MKKILSLISLSFTTFLFCQVGINTESPSVTLDVTGDAANVAKLDGISAPRISGDLLRAKTYTTAQTGAMVYVTLADTAPAGQTVNVTAAGYYYFDGAAWQVFKTAGVEPWNVEASAIKATLNNQNIYQNGNIGIGDFSAASPVAKLDVRGAIRGGTPDLAATIGSNSAAFGTGNIASGAESFASGNTNTVSGNQSVSWGAGNTSDNERTTAFGILTRASGENATAWGEGTRTSHANETSFGRYNAITNGDNGSSSSGIYPLLQIGNGAYNAGLLTRSNALTLLQNGSLGLAITGVDELAKPTERLDIGSGNVKVRDINTTTGTTGKIMIADAAGVLKTTTAASINNSTIQIKAALSMPYTTPNSGNLLLGDTHYTVRIFNGNSGITLPDASTCLGRIYILIGSNGISTKNITVAAGTGIYDDVTNANINTISANQRLRIQSDGTGWIVIGR